MSLRDRWVAPRPLVVAGYLLVLTTIVLIIAAGCATNRTASLTPFTWVCTVQPAGWTMEFINGTSSDIKITAYTVTFFDAAGHQTGSQAAANVPLTAAEQNSVSDTEKRPHLGAQCKLSSWS